MENNVSNSEANTNVENKPTISNEAIQNIEVNNAETIKTPNSSTTGNIDNIVKEQPKPQVPKDNNYYKCTVQCCIRRKPNMRSIPGQDEAEKVYRIGSALDVKTKRDLKGISGDLERLFMPSIVGLSSTDPGFGNAVSEYWSSISTIIPPDEEYLKDYEKGVKIDIVVMVLGNARKERLDGLTKISEKIEWLNENLTKISLVPVGDKTEERPFVRLEEEFVSDYLLLNYCLKYPKVANNFDEINNSPKIEFFIFEKALAVKTQLNLIDLRKKASKLYETLESDENRINSVLIRFNKNPKEFDNITDKLIEIDAQYNKNPDNMKKFVTYAEDTNWKIKYLINTAILENKLRVPPNSSAIYYNETLLGMNIEETAMFLTSDEKGKQIHESLVREINLK